jgi:hypothetical protein
MKLALTGLRRRDLYFKDLGVSAIMSLTTFNSLLYTIRDADFEPYREGDMLPDGGTSTARDPRKGETVNVSQGIHKHLWISFHWQEEYVSGPLAVFDEPMIGWTGATNAHVTVLPCKTTDKGICLKTLCDTQTQVMVALEFVESQDDQAKMRYVDKGKAAAVILWLTEPWHKRAPNHHC